MITRLKLYLSNYLRNHSLTKDDFRLVERVNTEYRVQTTFGKSRKVVDYLKIQLNIVESRYISFQCRIQVPSSFLIFLLSNN